MFPKNKVYMVYRFLCLVSYITVIILINSMKTLLILLAAYLVFSLLERNNKNIELFIVTLIILGICFLLNNYIAFKVALVIDYIFYFLDVSYHEEIVVSNKEYIRFTKKKKKKGSNNISAVYLTFHLVILFLAILVR